MADKTILDFTLTTDTFDTDIIYAVRGTGSDRDRYQTKGDFLANIGTTAIAALTTTGQTILARDSGRLLVSGGGDDALFSTVMGGNLKLESSTVEPYILYRNIGAFAWAVGMKDTNTFTFTTGSIGGSEVMRLTSLGNILIGTTIDSGPRLVVADGVGSLPTITDDTVLLLQSNIITTQSSFLSIVSGNAAISGIKFGDEQDENTGVLQYYNTDDSFRFVTNTSEAMRLTSTNHFLVNTTSDPGEILHVNGSARFTGTNGAIIVVSTGDTLEYTKAGLNLTYANSVGGFFRFITNGRSVSAANSSLDLNADQSVTVNTTLLVDTISEKTGGAGVTIDGVLLKDSEVTTDTINEKTAGAGITIDGVLLKDSGVTTDTISEKTASAGVTIDGLICKDQGFSNTVKFKFYSEGATTQGQIYSGISSWVPNIGDWMPVEGPVDTVEGKGYMFGIRRITATLIHVYFDKYDNTGTTTTFGNSGSGVSVTTFECWSNTQKGS